MCDKALRNACRRPNYANSLAKRGSVPIRDETGRFVGVRPKTAAERLQRQPLGSGGIFKSAAVDVLRLERRLMSTGQLCLHDLPYFLLQVKLHDTCLFPTEASPREVGMQMYRPSALHVEKLSCPASAANTATVVL